MVTRRRFRLTPRLLPLQIAFFYGDTVLGREQTMRWVLRTVAFNDPIPTIFYRLATT